MDIRAFQFYEENRVGDGKWTFPSLHASKVNERLPRRYGYFLAGNNLWVSVLTCNIYKEIDGYDYYRVKKIFTLKYQYLIG